VAGIVLAAYSYVGYFIFGHQYSGMQSFSKSMSTLFFMMMNFDPSQFWLEMMAAGGPFALHVFMWTYNVITFFILLNMFLAIIVDSYASVKADTEDSQGLLSELANVSWHGFRRIVDRSGDFISDQQLLEKLVWQARICPPLCSIPITPYLIPRSFSLMCCLISLYNPCSFPPLQEEEKKRCQTNGTERIERHQAVDDNLRPRVVVLPGGVRVTKSDLSRMVRFVPQNKMPSFARRNTSVSPEEGAEKLAGHARSGEAINDLMERYGSEMADLAVLFFLVGAHLRPFSVTLCFQARGWRESPCTEALLPFQEKRNREILEQMPLDNYQRLIQLNIGLAHVLDTVRP